MTVHGSKGMQADHVFVVNNRRGPMGFPDTRDESLLVGSLLEGRGDRYDEERRLFYVAIMRARRETYLLAVDGSESDFVKECDSLLSAKDQDA